ncbi:hypothetical protein ODJ79_27055 [Actinoplanes sp. KI2]|uniref:hypothetical protein n=1 Tax=Actinoplanes sp. KI2 TaxID=2983315 RepID=UPI0021D57954|nr:hypothetical protein [Actinoplanes sp. KI2]MCU7727407.1 hypothetical protein [Actinoplanes sp. KI2]
MPHDWRDSVRLAADLALLGIVLTLSSLPLVTAGAAVATGSYAIHHVTTQGRWPSFADCWAYFRPRLVPGLLAGPAVLAATALVVIDVSGLRRGAAPGGGPALAAVLTAAALAAGYVGLAAVLAGIRERGAAREALALALSRPLAAVTAAGVLAVAALLAVLVHPALVPVLAGYTLFALHAVARRRIGPAPETSPG